MTCPHSNEHQYELSSTARRPLVPVSLLHGLERALRYLQQFDIQLGTSFIHGHVLTNAHPFAHVSQECWHRRMRRQQRTPSAMRRRPRPLRSTCHPPARSSRCHEMLIHVLCILSSQPAHAASWFCVADSACVANSEPVEAPQQHLGTLSVGRTPCQLVDNGPARVNCFNLDMVSPCAGADLAAALEQRRCSRRRPGGPGGLPRRRQLLAFAGRIVGAAAAGSAQPAGGGAAGPPAAAAAAAAGRCRRRGLPRLAPPPPSHQLVTGEQHRSSFSTVTSS